MLQNFFVASFFLILENVEDYLGLRGIAQRSGPIIQFIFYLFILTTIVRLRDVYFKRSISATRSMPFIILQK